MTTSLITRPHQLVLELTPDRPLDQAAAAADIAAAARTFVRYRARLAEQTRRRQDADLACFTAYLTAVGLEIADDLATGAVGWIGISWGLITGFVEWQLQQDYAVGSVNVRLSTVKTYAKLAMRAGAISADTYAQIKTVAGFRQAEGRRIDTEREQTRRKGAKKAEPVSISSEQIAQLKNQSEPRDRLLMCLLLDHGLRVGEVAALTPADFDLKRGLLRFYRQKVDKTQTHRLTKSTLAAAEGYLPAVECAVNLFGVDRTIRTRVRQLGALVGLDKLSPHDCRHAWATAATRAGTPIKVLQDAGGWSSPAMPLRYAESAVIANEGLRLD